MASIHFRRQHKRKVYWTYTEKFLRVRLLLAMVFVLHRVLTVAGKIDTPTKVSSCIESGIVFNFRELAGTPGSGHTVK